ncbi:MAG: helix-turn-helix domain-containing protein [Phaeodactylibacter sp.]|nr:helix-turn-helix domain-containing protein [Phaeodactylibacter sp.]
MIYPIRMDMIPMLRHLVEAIQPFAAANFVGLVFEPEEASLEVNCPLDRVLPDLARLICRAIAFTPSNHEVRLSVSLQELEGAKKLSIRMENTGADLSYVREVVTGLDGGVEVLYLGNSGTRFEWSIPVEEVKTAPASGRQGVSGKESYTVPVFYQKLRKHMQAYTANMKSLEEAVARDQEEREQVFLKKVNAIILAKLGREDFDVAALARGLALSRSQLYRRIKSLVHLSPSQYIRYIRLQNAKELLESGNMTVGEAAFKTGFIDKSYFTRAFHRQFGFNPSYLRKASTLKKLSHDPGKEKQAVHHRVLQRPGRKGKTGTYDPEVCD